MTAASNKHLADQAQAIARKSEGLPRQAANCCLVALSYSPSVKVAREALEEIERPDVRHAALELLGQLAASSATDDPALP